MDLGFGTSRVLLFFQPNLTNFQVIGRGKQLGYSPIRFLLSMVSARVFGFSKAEDEA